MTGWEMVDDALDVMFRADPHTIHFDRNDLAHILGVGPSLASTLLQEHRRAQRRGVTRYVVAARDYARASRWYVLAAPGHPLGTGDRRRLSMGHAEHIAIDAARRIISDLASELDPALVSHPAMQAYLTYAGANMQTLIASLVGSVHSAVSLVESLSGETADRSSVKSI